MISNAIKYLFGLVAILLLAFIAFSIFQDKYMKASTGDFEVEEEPVSDFIVLEKIEAIGKIELVKYQMKDAVSYSNKKSTESIFIPDQKILMIIAGEAVGCVDFTKIKKEDILLGKDSVIIAMPQPELCYSKINHSECKVYDLSTARMLDKTELINQAYQLAEKRVERMALESNVLDETKKNAELMLKPLLQTLTGKRIIFTYQLTEKEAELKVID